MADFLFRNLTCDQDFNVNDNHKLFLLELEEDTAVTDVSAVCILNNNSMLNKIYQSQLQDLYCNELRERVRALINSPDLNQEEIEYLSCMAKLRT